MRRKAFILSLLLALFSGMFHLEVLAQDFDAFARVRVSPREVVVRQPFRISISVHTATWYTAPLQFGNLRMENAFIIPFTRTQSSMEYIRNKKYASLTFYYLVIPYESGSLELPSLAITATTPPVGDYKGVPITLSTPSQRIEVEDLPENKEGVWTVARNMNFREQWDKDLEGLKTGDILERTIVLDASGTLPSLIQPLELESPEGVSLYPAPAELKDTRTNQDVNGRRTERYSYLFEEEGEIVIPEKQILWWNPSSGKIHSRTLPERRLQIAANPDLDIMHSLKDSLDALQMSNLPLEESPSFPWKRFGSILLGGMVALYMLVRIIRMMIRIIRKRRRARRESSGYFLRRCRRALRKGDARAFVNALYTWVDHSRRTGQPATVSAYLTKEELESFVRFMEKVMSTEKEFPAGDWKKRMPSLLKHLNEQL